MKTKEMIKILEKFINNSSYKSILFDGPWGCGKTYQINQFIKNINTPKHRPKIKIHYVSLFGLESIDEINTSLYQTIHPIKKKFKKIGYLISKTIRVIPNFSDISVALDFQLDQSRKKIKGKHLIIFDDLERISEKVKFIDLFGYLNSLYLSGCRFVCLVSSDNINKNKKEDFQSFKEKTFDCLYIINENNDEGLEQIFKKLNIDYINNLFPLFRNNLRLANKVKIFFLEIKTHLKKNEKILNFPFNDFELLQTCIFTVSICFGHHKIEIPNNDKNFKNDERIFNTAIATELFYLRNAEKDFFSINSKTIFLYNLIHLYLYMDYKNFDSYYRKLDQLQLSILEKDFFYLSDDNKKIFYDAFLSFCQSPQFQWNDKNMNILISILAYSNQSFDETTIKMIASKIPNNYDLRHHLSIAISILCIGSEETKKCNDFKENLIKNYTELIEEKEIKNFIILGKNPNYEKLSNYLNRNDFNDDITQKIIDILENNNYFFPNLTMDISQSEWHYAHQLSKFISKSDRSDNYKLFLEGQIKENSSNKSFKDRINFLLKEYLN